MGTRGPRAAPCFRVPVLPLFSHTRGRDITRLRSKCNNKLFSIYQINVHAEALGTQLTMEMFSKNS